MDALLRKHVELENQSIYFADPAELNDPMEGYRDLFWSGDRIAWANLFRHFLLCLDNMYLQLLLGEKGVHLSIHDIPVYATLSDLPTDEYRERFKKLQEYFFANDDIQTLLDGVASAGRCVRRDELRFYLENVHVIVLHSIGKINEATGVNPSRIGSPSTSPSMGIGTVAFFKLLNMVSQRPEGSRDVTKTMFEAYAQMHAQLSLVNRLQNKIDVGEKNKNFVLLEFSDAYLKAVERLVFPDWYTACFMSECTNSSIWGHYGLNHTGVCLIFKAEDVGGTLCLPLRGNNSADSSGSIKGMVKMPFHPVVYAESYAEIDFFRSIGRLPMPALQSMWYSDSKGNLSDCSEDLYSDNSGWQSRYWTHFLGDILRKTKDWAYEHEHRLILYGNLVDYSQKQHRTMNYDFSSLRGLIFGINASTEDKLEVIRIILQKCVVHKRSDFEFYQAYYSAIDGDIAHVPLTLLQKATNDPASTP